MHRALGAGLLAIGMLLGSTAISSAQVVLVRGNDTDPATLDHHKTSTISKSRVLNDLYDGLVTQDAAGNTIPGAAESWEISEDGTTYTFHMRPDGKWSNGDPVTSEDFLFAFRRIMDPATAAGYASILFPILNAEAVNKGEMPVEELGVAAPDPQTLVFTLNGPTPYFLQLLTHQTGKPLHRASVEALGADFTKPGNLVTNGAYMLESFVPNDKIVLKKNPNYYDAASVTIDEVQWLPFEDRSACLRRFEAGEVLVCADVPAEQMTYMKEKLPDQLRIAPYLGAYYLPVKTTKEKFADPRVRQAISMLIDRDFIAEEVWQGTMLPAYSLVPPGIDNYVGEPARARLCRRGSARPRGQGAGALRGGGRRSGDAGDPAQLQLVGEPPQHHGGGGGQSVERRHQVDAERDGGDQLLQLPARGRRLRHRPRRLDRRLQRSAELPLHQRVRASPSTIRSGRTPTTTRR